jgi:hypothetical protein
MKMIKSVLDRLPESCHDKLERDAQKANLPRNDVRMPEGTALAEEEEEEEEANIEGHHINTIPHANAALVGRLGHETYAEKERQPLEHADITQRKRS